jgi:uncharacterized protein YgiM (DUF1202 family)
MKRIGSVLLIALMSLLLLPSTAQAQPKTPPASNEVAQDTVQATVGVRILNVRRAPRLNSSILGKLLKGEVVTLIARADGPVWVQANTRFGVGWIAREFLIVGPTAQLPITTVMPPFLKSGVHEGLNIRFGPSDDYPIASLLRAGVEADVIAYYPRPLWYKVAIADGRVGWVYSASVQLFGTLDNTPTATELPMIRVMTYNLKVHPEPNIDSTPLGVVRLGSTFFIVGRDSRGNWWKIRGKFGEGWVIAGYTSTIGSTQNVPVLFGPAPLPVLQ